ncbi:hypothetical protein N9043_01055 [bacterium]|nr:hypothetical protein [bacterium]
MTTTTEINCNTQCPSEITVDDCSQYITACGYTPYYKLINASRKPTVECFNSFAVCIPQKTTVTINIKGLPEIRLPAKCEGYCTSFGPFDELLSDVKINAKSFTNIHLAFSRSSSMVPATLDIPSHCEDKESNFQILPVCIVSKVDSDVPKSKALLKIYDNTEDSTGEITTVLYTIDGVTELNMNDYHVVECC